MMTMFGSRKKAIYALVTSLVIAVAAVLFLLSLTGTKSEAVLNCISDDPTVLAAVDDVKARLEGVGLSDSRSMLSIGVDNHLERMCSGEVEPDVLFTYASQLETLNEIGRQYGQLVPADLWDAQSSEMREDDIQVYEVVDTLVGSQLEYAQLMIRAYNRFYTFKESESDDTALDTALDIFLYTVEYHEQLTGVDFDTMDAETAREIGMEIVRTWQELIGYTFRTNPLTGDPLFPYDIFTHFSITNMWRYHIQRNLFIGVVWGVTGFDSRFVGHPQNSNQVEHVAVTTALQYVYDYSTMALNALEVRDTLSGKQQPAESRADQSVNTLIASEFIPRFEDGYVQAIEYLRCVLSSPEETLCTTT